MSSVAIESSAWPPAQLDPTDSHFGPGIPSRRSYMHHNSNIDSSCRPSNLTCSAQISPKKSRSAAVSTFTGQHRLHLIETDNNVQGSAY